MEQDSGQPRKLEFEPRLLALFLFIAIPFMLGGSLLIMNSVRNEIKKQTGENLAELAAANARYLDSYILMKVSDISRLVMTPVLVDEVVASNGSYPADEDLVRKRLTDADRDWIGSGGLTPLAIDIVRRESSRYLREVAELSHSYEEILLTDVHGAVIATTNVTTDYNQSDEAWWRKAYGDGETGTIQVSNVQFDASAREYGLDVAVPVRIGDGGGERVVGILKALIGVHELFAVLEAVKVGESGHALLLNFPDKTIITSDDPSGVMSVQHPGFVHLNEAIADGRRSFVCQHEDGSTWLTGFSRMPEPAPSGEIIWYVFVEQLVDEAQAPARDASMYLLLFFGAMVLLVLIFSLYMHFRLVRPIREVDLREEMDRLSTATSGTPPG